MKSLFGNALMDPKKMNEATEEDEDDNYDDNMEELEGESEQDVGSEGSWETEDEENVNSEDDSGHDSMDDLPEELKVIAAQLEDKKRKSDPLPDTPAKKNKTGSKMNTATPRSKTSIVSTEPRSAEKSLKAKKLVDVKKQVSAMLNKPAEKPSAPALAPASAKKSTKSVAPPKDIKRAKTKTASTKSLASSSAGPGWKLGDGWSKGFEDSDEDILSSKTKKGKKGPAPSQKAASQRGKGRAFTKSKKQ